MNDIKGHIRLIMPSLWSLMYGKTSR